MAMIKAPWVNKPVWVDLSSADPAASRAFYSSLFGWTVEVNPDPQYGGYAVAELGGQRVAGIGPKMMPEAPTAWMIYLGTDDADGLSNRVQAAGGTVIAPAMNVGNQGRMAVYADPSGAIISAWQPIDMAGFGSGVPNAFSWAELNSRGLSGALPFYTKVFGWDPHQSPMGEGNPPYTEFHLGGASIAGGMEMNPMVPPAVPSYWMAYFGVENVDDMFKKALAAGATEMVSPMDFPGGRFAILSDPQGAAFGLLSMAPQS